jgi:hypothetical protein
MSTKIETQRVYVVENSLTFLIPSSYDPEWNTLSVFAAPAGTDRGVPVQWTLHSSGDQVIVQAPLQAGDVVVVRVQPIKETLFTKQTRQALTSGQTNTLYEHCLALASSADDKILSEYGIVITGNIPPEDIATKDELGVLEGEVDLNTDEINRVGDGILVRLDALEAGGDPGILTKASKAQAQAGTDDSTYMTPLRNRDSEQYHDLKHMVITVLSATEELTGDSAGIINMKLPKLLDGMYIKDIEVNTNLNASFGDLIVTVKQDTTIMVTAELPQNVLYVSKDDPNVTIPTIVWNSGTDLIIDLGNNGRTITGLTVGLTFGWIESRYV